MDGVSGFYGFKPFDVRMPVHQEVPFVFNSPHSGRVYPPPFLEQSRLDARSIRRSEDYFVDELFDAVTHLGAPLLAAHFPRAFLDVNREPYELDPRMFDGRLPAFANVSSMRVAGGLGTIPRLVAENMEIYPARIPAEEGVARVEGIYRPYHDALRRLMLATRQTFGYAVLIDCHSMPGTVRAAGSAVRPDFVIGDRYGTSAAQDIARAAVSLFKGMGYSVSRNKPYAGGFITQHYGRPARGFHALQIEINRGLYVDEATMEKTAGFAAVRADIRSFCESLIGFVVDHAGDQPLAAE